MNFGMKIVKIFVDKAIAKKKKEKIKPGVLLLFMIKGQGYITSLLVFFIYKMFGTRFAELFMSYKTTYKRIF